MRICIDMDEVMVDNYQEYRRMFKEHYGFEIDPQEYRGRKIYQLEGYHDIGFIRRALHEPGHFRHLPVMEGAVEGVRELYEKYEVFVVTAATEFKYSFTDKYEWLAEHMPFIHWSRIVFCGDKSIAHGDFLIDDKPKNLDGFSGTGLLFTSSANVNATGYHRLNNWDEVREYFRAREESLQARQA